MTVPEFTVWLILERHVSAEWLIAYFDWNLNWHSEADRRRTVYFKIQSTAVSMKQSIPTWSWGLRWEGWIRKWMSRHEGAPAMIFMMLERLEWENFTGWAYLKLYETMFHVEHCFVGTGYLDQYEECCMAGGRDFSSHCEQDSIRANPARKKSAWRSRKTVQSLHHRRRRILCISDQIVPRET